MNQYVGIADCHGLESFIYFTNIYAKDLLMGEQEISQTLHMLKFRAQANRHRWAVVYKVDLDRKDAEIIQKYQDSGKHKEALMELKIKAKMVELEKGNGINAEKFWNNIPNDDLDPYS